MKKFEDLLGKVLKSVHNYDDEIVFTLENGEAFKLYHEQECCESVTVEDVCGSLDDLVGSPILMAEEVSNYCVNPEGVLRLFQDNSFTWTFYKLATVKGYVTIRWYGESNGYYSEGVSWGRALE